MDAGQHDLPVSRPRQALHLRGHILRLTAADAPSGVGDDAVAAELIAAILDLEERPGLMRKRMDVQRLEHMDAARRHHRLRRALLVQRGRDPLRQLALALRADDDIRLQRGDIGRVGSLCIAADHSDERRRVLAARLMDLLAALRRRGIGDAAGVDHIDIGFFPEVHLRVSGLFQAFQIILRLICIHLAPQRCDRKGCHVQAG